MQAWNGMFGVSPHDGITSPDYAIYEFTHEQVHPAFVEYLIRTPLYAAEFRCRSKGIGTGFLRLNPSEFLSTPLWLPDYGTQREIAEFLDRETGRIARLIDTKNRQISRVAERIEALVGQAISDPSSPRVRFEYLVERIQRPVDLSQHEELVRLGLFNRGRGIFKKPAADEEDLGDSEFFFIVPGDLILSGQFAWEGAVALATESEAGCVVSHRYPVYVGRKGIRTAYLLGVFRSGFGAFLLNEASRGSAGRNRPLNTWRLGKEKIPLAGTGLQESVEAAIHFERRLREKTSQSISRLVEFRTALITAAVTGQLDISRWENRRHVDRRLDRIRESVGE
jgi:type I restriction enzyme S subunit